MARDAAFKGSRVPFLPLRVQADSYRGGGNVGVISWRDKGQKNDPTISPTLAFNNMVAGLAPKAADPAAQAARDRMLREETSVLDLVSANAERLRSRLGRADQQRLERHFDEIRELERRLAVIPATGPGGAAPPRPGPALTRASRSPGRTTRTSGTRGKRSARWP